MVLLAPVFEVFIEKRFGVFERNISPWRRAVAGDVRPAAPLATHEDGNPRGIGRRVRAAMFY
jgi:phospholipase C